MYCLWFTKSNNPYLQGDFIYNNSHNLAHSYIKRSSADPVYTQITQVASLNNFIDYVISYEILLLIIV